MVHMSGKRTKPKKTKHKTKLISTDEEISEIEFHRDNKISFKITVRKGARIESVPKKKLEKLPTKQRRFWKFENDWLIQYGLTSPRAKFRSKPKISDGCLYIRTPYPKS